MVQQQRHLVNPGNWWRYDENQNLYYIQDKLEYEGMIANVGLRADILQPGASPFNLNTNYIFQTCRIPSRFGARMKTRSIPSHSDKNATNCI
ncbi:MAG: hypothetical protein R3C26_07620 [Calditrichia bacterium]